MAAKSKRSKKSKPRTQRKRHRLPLWKKMAFAGVVFFLAGVVLAAGLEITLALKYPAAGFNAKWGGARYTWGHKTIENRLGFREREFEVPKPEGVYRVMVLGDSFTWGAGLAEEDRYTNRLEELLAARHPGQRVEVLNFGVSGGPTVRERDILREHVDAVDPDLVVIGFCFNDPQPREQRYSPEAEKYLGLFATLHRARNLGLSRSIVLLDGCLWGTMENVGMVPRWQAALQRVYEPDSSEWQQFVDALGDITSICDERELPPPVFIALNQGTGPTQPTDYGNPDDELEMYLRWYHQAEEAARTAGMVTLNVEQELAQQMPGEPMGVNPLDGHPSAECNAIYAEKLAECIDPLLGQAAERVAVRPVSPGQR